MAAIVTSISGTLKVLPYGTEEWTEARKGMFLYEGDQLKTGANSRAGITFANGIELKINENSTFTIQITEEREMKNAIDLLIGEIFSKIMIEGVKFEMHTPVAVAAVRGTEFNTNVRKSGLTTVLVYKGIVEVWNELGSVTVTEAKKTVVQPNQAPQPPQEVDLELEPGWQKEVEIKGSLNIELESSEQVVGLLFGLTIEALDSKGDRNLDFEEGVILNSTSGTVEFSIDRGRSWRTFPARVMLKRGWAEVMLKDSRSEKLTVSATYPDLDSAIADINIVSAKEKDLILKIRDEEGEKTLRLKFKR
ncbi:MAG: FecR domain-containing protein [bacterium]